MPEVPGVDHKDEVRGVSKTSMIKDSTNPILEQRSHAPPVVILAWSEGPSVPTELSTDRVGLLI